MFTVGTFTLLSLLSLYSASLLFLHLVLYSSFLLEHTPLFLFACSLNLSAFVFFNDWKLSESTEKCPPEVSTAWFWRHISCFVKPTVQNSKYATYSFATVILQSVTWDVVKGCDNYLMEGHKTWLWLIWFEEGMHDMLCFPTETDLITCLLEPI